MKAQKVHSRLEIQDSNNENGHIISKWSNQIIHMSPVSKRFQTALKKSHVQFKRFKDFKTYNMLCSYEMVFCFYVLCEGQYFVLRGLIKSMLSENSVIICFCYMKEKSKIKERI